MRKMKRPDRYKVFVCTALFMVSIAGSRPLIPLYAYDLGVSHAEIGVIVALFSFLPLFLSIYLGKMIDRVGIKGPLIASIVFGILSMVIVASFNNITGVYLSQVFAGFAQLVFVLSIQAYSGQFSKSKLREYYIAVFSIAVAAGSFIGPLITGFLSDTFSYTYAFFSLGIILIFILPISFFFTSKKTMSKINGKPKNNAFLLLRLPDLRKAVLVSSIVLLAKDTYNAFFPLLAVENGLSAFIIGVIVALNAGAGMLIRGFLPWISQHLKRDVVITLSIFFAGLSYLLHPITDHVISLSILSLVLGFCTGIAQPLSIFATIIALPKERVAEGLGLRLTFNKLTQIIAPLSLGAVSGLTGMSGVFFLCGAVIMAGSVNSQKIALYKRR
ncbi:MFS transporter [Domibacillus sp. DTU_2020_1001157_1_SI_ALB_TIR_016]|uniref:MFS transporter n=1 Tax=Domibacillus sp. DTU_2020_1001157_1_SI_ALB_TIR_016 TaxID=3077789 RepID=UPI0028EBBC07|nr:MFS transporter [Domibacillus sp. DTU_2020_1001157_1_SI_ALB_TIR_016]WNS78624.1 MFS transporter [Domibacillus sp. DTU_2020_1001157_1_SI_ALB_TIR_016]